VVQGASEGVPGTVHRRVDDSLLVATGAGTVEISGLAGELPAPGAVFDAAAVTSSRE